MEIRTYDKDQAKEWKGHGLNVKTKSDDRGTFYKVGLKRKALYQKAGTKAAPVQVVDGNLQPLDSTIIGNRSVGNVQITKKPWKSPLGEGWSFELFAVQVTTLVEFDKNALNKLAFDEVGETEVTEDKGTPALVDDSSDLWD